MRMSNFLSWTARRRIYADVEAQSRTGCQTVSIPSSMFHRDTGARVIPGDLSDCCSVDMPSDPSRFIVMPSHDLESAIGL